MITYAGLARIVAVVAGALSAGLPPGHPAMKALSLGLRELRALAADQPTAGEVTVRRAVGIADRGLWLHRCGNVGRGTPVTDVPPGYCEQCYQTGGWERLYVNTASTPE